MDFLRDLAAALPIDEKYLRKVPIPGLVGRVLLEIDLGRGASEGAPVSPVEALRARNTPQLKAIVDGLRRGAQDDKVAGLVVHAATGVTMPQAQELHAAIAAFRAGGKPTLAWSEAYGEVAHGTTGYLVAAACEEVWLQPSGDVNLTGAVLGGLFLRGALDKLHVQPQFLKRHEYKSAAEMFMDTQMSPANREMLQAVTGSVNAHVVEAIAAARGLTGEQVEAAMTTRLSATAARDAGLVDGIGYRDEAMARLRARVGGTTEDTPLRYVERYAKTPTAASVKRHRPVVAVVQAQGAIHLGRSGGQQPMGGHTIGADTLGASLRSVAQDKDVRAVVLRIDSPGGSYVASDAIRREVLRLRESGRPVIASMADVAASGGYFIAMPCERIVADAATLTGSIGVLSGKLVTAAAWERLGVRRQSVAEHTRDEMYSPLRPFGPEEIAQLDEWLDEVYADFAAKAAADRGLPLDVLEPLARGRVWSGADAAQRGLVDELGGLDEAIGLACAAAGIDRADALARVSPKLGPFDRLLPTDSSDAPVGASLGEGLGLFDAAVAALGLGARGVLTMPDVRLR